MAFKAPRKKNFLDLEVSMLVDEISANKQIYLGKFSSTITKESKSIAWGELTEKINSVCGQSRTPKDLEKKWYNLQATAVREVGHYSKEVQKTGGGPHPKSPSETAVRIVGNVVHADKVIGIKGGCDSMAIDAANSSESEQCQLPEKASPIREMQAQASTTQNLLVKLQGFNSKPKDKKKETPASGDSISGLLEIEKRKLQTDEERDLEREMKTLKLKKIKLEIEILERNRDIDFELKHKEIKLKEALIKVAALKTKVLEFQVASQQQITYVVQEETNPFSDILS